MRQMLLACLCSSAVLVSSLALAAAGAPAKTGTAPAPAKPALSKVEGKAPASPSPATAEAIRADLDRILADAGVPQTSLAARVIVLPEAAGRIAATSSTPPGRPIPWSPPAPRNS